MIRVFGADTLVERLGPDDFQKLRKDLQKTHKSLTSINSDIGKIKAFFNWAGPGTTVGLYRPTAPFRQPSSGRPSRPWTGSGKSRGGAFSRPSKFAPCWPSPGPS